jgi:hypothetical protein
VLAIMYEVPLPRGYDLAIVRRSVNQIARFPEAVPGLVLGIHGLRGVDESEPSPATYAWFMLWSGSDATASYLSGKGQFAALRRDLGPGRVWITPGRLWTSSMPKAPSPRTLVSATEAPQVRADMDRRDPGTAYQFRGFDLTCGCWRLVTATRAPGPRDSIAYDILLSQRSPGTFERSAELKH